MKRTPTLLHLGAYLATTVAALATTTIEPGRAWTIAASAAVLAMCVQGRAHRNVRSHPTLALLVATAGHAAGAFAVSDLPRAGLIVFLFTTVALAQYGADNRPRRNTETISLN